MKISKTYLRKHRIKLTLLSIGLIWYAFCLPGQLFQEPTSTVVVSVEDKLLGAKIAKDGQWRFPENKEVPEKFKTCLVLFEDEHFYKHPGFNPVSIVKAIQQNREAGKIVRGGSTLTQQVIRLSRKNPKRTYFEKFKEIILATRLEVRASKEEILSLWANNAPFGGNVVGLEAASWRYFNRSPENLSWAESATLAILPNAPTLIYPGKNQEKLRQKRDRLLKKLLDNSIIDSLTYQLSIQEEIPPKPYAIPQITPHLLQKISKKHEGQLVKSTVEYHLQNQVNQIIKQHYQQLSQNEIYNAAVLVMDVKTRRILAYVGNTPTTVAHQKDVDIIDKPRSTGSILKPFLYGAMLDKKGVKLSEEKVLVFDFGGGTYDVSVVYFDFDPAASTGEVKGTDGDNHLGGVDFDNLIISMAKDEYKRKYGNDNLKLSSSEEKKNEIRLRQEAIKVKTQLSTSNQVTFSVSCYRGSNDLVFELSRTRFERKASAIFQKLMEKCKGVLLSTQGVNPVYDSNGFLNTNLTGANNKTGQSLDVLIENGKDNIDRVVMVGGSSRIPKVQEILKQFFKDTPQKEKVVTVLNPDECVAYGAGYHANSIHPIEGSSGGNILLIEQAPLNFNIETNGREATPIISARSTLPCKFTQTFTTAVDNQTAVTIVVTQGNHPISKENYHVGQFNLSGIPPAPKGVPQIEVTFELSTDNILNISAMDLGSKNKESMAKNLTDFLDDATIEEMKKKSEDNSKVYEEIRTKLSIRNSYEKSIYDIEDKLDKAKKDNLLPQEIVDNLANIVSEEFSWLQSDDYLKISIEEINNHINEKKEELNKMLESVSGGSVPEGGVPEEKSPDVEEVQ